MFIIALTVIAGITSDQPVAKTGFMPTVYTSESDCESALWRATSEFNKVSSKNDILLIKCVETNGEIKGKSST